MDKVSHEFVERDGPGRRDNDRYKCALHDTIEGRNLDCFNIVKQDIRDIKDQMRHHVGDANAIMLEHEREQSKSMKMYVSKWVLGILLTILITVMGTIMGFISNQVSDIHTDVKMIENSTHIISGNVVKFRTIQEAVVENQKELKRQISNLPKP